MSILSSKNIVLGITGCIAAYKIPELVRLFVKDKATVDVIVSRAALEFVTKTTLMTLSKNKVHEDMFDEPEYYDVNHISLADKADLLLIAPATANIIGKLANGIADDLLSTVAIATRAPVVIAPAMNVNMWHNPIVQENIEKLKTRGFYFIEPESGELACGYEGPGRLRNIHEIHADITALLSKNNSLIGRKILVTVGGTREYIDPVRYITNKSSGKMGIAIAKEAIYRGAAVHIISTVEIKDLDAEIINVETAVQMKSALEKLFPEMDILIMAAAVADFSVAEYRENKIKKHDNLIVTGIDLVKNPDLISQMSKIKKDHQLVIGFAAETENVFDNAQEKLRKKNLDLVVANDVSRSDIGMGSDDNEVSFIFPDSRCEQLSKTSKTNVAKRLLNIIEDMV
jgi:phosphopantothenoylcysteine decarboxylase/phosphopantothenate--cysteine ligase